MSTNPGKLKIALLAHEFLINTGANDFLKNIIRGLAHNKEAELLFLCPRSDQKMEHMAPANFKARMGRYPRVKNTLREIAKNLRPLGDKFVKTEAGEYSHYTEACPNMSLVPCGADASSLIRLRDELQIDLFMPSIHILPDTLPHLTYWPDCQPKHLPEFFDDEAQRVRDERIRGLLNTGRPMIINSQDAKQDMVRFYGAASDQIFDLPFAPIIEVNKLVPRPELARRYPIRKSYFIVCNQFWIHKSAETVIEAAAICKRRGLDIEFVFTGKLEEPRRPEYIDWIKQRIRELDVTDVVRLLGYIPKDDQLELMKNAIAVVQPTLFEGGPGGGAVYDAYSLGVRAIVSDIPINHELPLESGKISLFEKKNSEDLADKLRDATANSYDRPSPEDLYLQSKASTELLSASLYEAIANVVSDQRG